VGSREFEACEAEQDGLRVDVVVQPVIDAVLVDNPPIRRVRLTLYYGAGPTARIPTSYLAAEEPVRAAVEHALAELTPLADLNSSAADLWTLSELRSIDDLARPTVLAVAARVEAARAALAARPRLAAMVRELPGPAAIGGLVPAAALATAGRLPHSDLVAAAGKDGWETGIAYVHHAVTALWRDFAGELSVFRDDILRWPYLDEVAKEAVGAADHMLPWIRRARLRSIIEQLAPYLPDGYRLEPAVVPIVLARLRAVRTAVARIEQQLEQFGGLALPAGWRPTRPKAPDDLGRAIHATRIARAVHRELPLAWAYLSRDLAFDDGKILQFVDQAWRDWSALLRGRDPDLDWYDVWQRYGAEWLREVRDEGLGGLRRRAALLRCLDALRDAGLAEFRQQLLAEEIRPDEAELAYRRGLATRELAEHVQAGDLSVFEPAAQPSVVDKKIDIAIFDELPPRVAEANGTVGRPAAAEPMPSAPAPAAEPVLPEPAAKPVLPEPAAKPVLPAPAAEPLTVPAAEPPTVPAAERVPTVPVAEPVPPVPAAVPPPSAPAAEPERPTVRLPVQAPPRQPRAPAVPAPQGRGRGRGRGKSSARQWRKR
jgi:hypothetical protein